MSEDTTAAAAPDPKADAGEGPKPEPTTKPAPAKPDEGAAKVPDEAYVKSLRKEAAGYRKQLDEANARLKALEDRDKSELERASEKAAASERRAVEAEAQLVRVEVAASRNMPATAVPLLTGTTREEIEATADALQAFAKANEKAPPSFDGGARQTPEATQSPEAAHNDFLLKALGLKPQ